MIKRILCLITVLAVLCGICAAAFADDDEDIVYQYDEDISVRIVYDFLMNDIGFNKAVASGIIANFVHESGIRTTALGDYGTSYGLCQWHSERWKDLKKFANSVDLPMEDITAQLLFLKSELSGEYKPVYDYLVSLPDNEQGAYDAAFHFSLNFEKPEGYEATADSRGETAKTVYGKKLHNIPYSIPVMKIIYMLTIYQRTYKMPEINVSGVNIIPRGTETYVSWNFEDTKMSYDDGYWFGVAGDSGDWGEWNPDGGYVYQDSDANRFEFNDGEAVEDMLAFEFAEEEPAQQDVQPESVQEYVQETVAEDYSQEAAEEPFNEAENSGDFVSADFEIEN